MRLIVILLLAMSLGGCVSDGLGFARDTTMSSGYCIDSGNCTSGRRVGGPSVSEAYIGIYPVDGLDAN